MIAANKRMAASRSFVAEAEQIVEEVGDWGARYIEDIVDVLMPDGRAYGERKRSEDEQMMMYVSTVKGNQQQWDAWIEERVTNLKKKLAESGLDDEHIVMVRPYEIVQAFAITYSARMERLLREETRKSEAQRESQDLSLPEDIY